LLKARHLFFSSSTTDMASMTQSPTNLFGQFPEDNQMDTVQKERRRYIRHQMSKNVLSISKDTLAEVLDISPCGMGCKCLRDSAVPLTQVTEIEIVNCDADTSVEGLRCRLVRVRERKISDALPSTMIVNFGLEFGQVTQAQKQQLDTFIKENVLCDAGVFY
jgi:c-di-GMP-binding flagellar brake protein YcgR